MFLHSFGSSVFLAGLSVLVSDSALLAASFTPALRLVVAIAF
jgi:hypothetical protein